MPSVCVVVVVVVVELLVTASYKKILSASK